MGDAMVRQEFLSSTRDHSPAGLRMISELRSALPPFSSAPKLSRLQGVVTTSQLLAWLFKSDQSIYDDHHQEGGHVAKLLITNSSLGSLKLLGDKFVLPCNLPF